MALPKFAFASDIRQLEAPSQNYIAFDFTMKLDGREVLNQRVFSYGDNFGVYELDDVILQAMRAAGSTISDIEFKAVATGTSTRVAAGSGKVLYSIRAPFSSGNLEDWLEENFLSLYSYKRLSADTPIFLSAYLKEGESNQCFFRFQVENSATGEISSHLYSLYFGGSDMAPLGKVYTLGLSRQTLLGHAAASLGVDASFLELVSLNATCGRRNMIFYFDDDLRDAQVFVFRNNFNLPEACAVPCQVTEITNVSAEQASLMGVVTAYDRKLSKSYKVKSGQIPPNDFVILEDLLCSHEILHVVSADVQEPVVVSDIKLERDKFDILSSCEFSYRYADKFMKSSLLDITSRIFSPEFNYIYS